MLKEVVGIVVTYRRVIEDNLDGLDYVAVLVDDGNVIRVYQDGRIERVDTQGTVWDMNSN